MKGKYKTVLLTIFLSAMLLTACSENTNNNKKPETSVSQVSKTTVSKNNTKLSQNEISQESSEKENSEANEESLNIISETSNKSNILKNSQADEEEGYFFDDEQIVEDYHTVQTFTDDGEFNTMFKNNSIDEDYENVLREVASITEMRKITTEFAEKWKEQTQTAYERLKELLVDNPKELEKLEESQGNWIDSIDKTEEEFYNQANTEALDGEFGSQLLLSADTAMMNYYKGRAAVLYQQIFVLSGNMEIA